MEMNKYNICAYVAMKSLVQTIGILPSPGHLLCIWRISFVFCGKQDFSPTSIGPWRLHFRCYLHSGISLVIKNEDDDSIWMYLKSVILHAVFICSVRLIECSWIEYSYPFHHNLRSFGPSWMELSYSTLRHQLSLNGLFFSQQMVKMEWQKKGLNKDENSCIVSLWLLPIHPQDLLCPQSPIRDTYI